MLHGYTPAERFLPYLSWTEVAALPDKANTVIVLPVGAMEQHGPHLPCSVDATIAAGVVGAAMEQLAGEHLARRQIEAADEIVVTKAAGGDPPHPPAAGAQGHADRGDDRQRHGR